MLDVGVGRSKLSKYFDQKNHDPVPIFRPKPIKVIIEAEIIDQWGHDDGTSIEFELNVKKIKVKS